MFRGGIVATLLAATTFLWSCNGGAGGDNNAEGIILYDLTYPGYSADNIFTSMFPSTMEFTFKGSNTRTEMKTSMAVFSTILLADQANKRLVHLVKIASKLSGLELDSAQVMAEYGHLSGGLRLGFTDSVKQIAGYNCKNAVITFDSDPSRVYSLYYTDDIHIPDPNWCTPYHAIKGVLLEARVNKFGIEMHMKAREVKFQEVDKTLFEVPATYERITVEEMADIFSSF